MALVKKIPEDFVVRELSKPVDFLGGPYSYFWMRKRNVSTQDALQQVARSLRVHENDIGIAGSKDKHAQTEQLISVRSSIERDVDVSDDISLEFRGRARAPLSLGELLGNKFDITIRDMAPDEVELVGKNAKLLEELGFMLPNYFDEQRFSTANIELGIELLKKRYPGAVHLLEEHAPRRVADVLREYRQREPHDFVGALRLVPRRLLMLYVHSVQSHIFNEMVSGILESHGKCVHVSYSRGEFLFPRTDVPQHQVPLAGFGVEVADETIASLLRENLARHNLIAEDFINRSLPHLSAEGLLRPLLMEVRSVRIAPPKEDELDLSKKKIQISFELDSGSYATIVLKFLLAQF